MTDTLKKAEVAHLKDRLDEMRQDRAPHEAMWSQIAEFIFPRRDFYLSPEGPNARRRRSLTDTTAQTAHQRLSALLHGYMINPYQPWFNPALSDRPADRDEALWFEDVRDRMFRFYSGSRSSFRTASHETLQDDTAFGNSVLWMGRRRFAAPPFYKAIPLKEAFFAENDEGQVDTLYREWHPTLAQAHRAFPDCGWIKDKFKDEKEENSQKLHLIHAVEPRADGAPGASATRKPFSSAVYDLSEDKTVKVSGFDGFPYAVTRFNRRAGETYGVGVGWDSLPMVKLLNAMMDTILRQAELAADPPLVDMSGRLETLDRSAGAVNSIDVSDMGMMQPEQILRRVHEGGDVQPGVELLRDIRAQVESMWFTDWMTLRENSAMTATEINERRDLRLRSMSPIVARGEQEKLTVTVDRTFQLMQESNMFLQPPQSLDGAQIEWEYTSPLAMAQRLGEIEASMRSLDLAATASQLDPEALHVLDLPEIVRDGATAAGSPTRHTRSREDVAERIEAMQKAIERKAEIADAAAAAGGIRDLGQGAQSLNAAGAEAA